MREVHEPTKVWVAPYEFPLHFVPPDAPELEGADGMTDTSEEGRGIWINAALDDRKTLEIVWHEVTHAINWVHDVTNRMRSEEVLARKHGIAWSQFWLDNPKFIRWYDSVVKRIHRERK